MDDEPLIRAIVARALRAAGYDVVAAESAERAVEILATEGATLALLLSDVDMPGASGPELIQHARGAFPFLPTQLMSASSKDSLVGRGVLSTDEHLLQKPFKVAELLARLDQLLER